MAEPFPELDAIIEHLISPKMVEERISHEKIIMGIVWEHRFWETING